MKFYFKIRLKINKKKRFLSKELFYFLNTIDSYMFSKSQLLYSFLVISNKFFLSVNIVKVSTIKLSISSKLS